MNNYIYYIVEFVIVIFSLSLHEASHAYAASKFGDDTAKDAGRISLNPLVHIDPFATLLLPLFLIYIHSPIVVGAAKPTPVNYANIEIKKRRKAMAMISFAGPLSNFALAVLCALVIKSGITNSVSYPILLGVIFINLVLGIFNLIPIPPLDGSKILASILPEEWWPGLFSLERWGFILVLAFLYFGLLNYILSPVIYVFWQGFHLSLNDLAAVLGGY